MEASSRPRTRHARLARGPPPRRSRRAAVKPSNNKLIDRAARYVRLLAEKRTGTLPPYDTIIHALFAERELMQIGEPIVLKTLNRLLGVELRA